MFSGFFVSFAFISFFFFLVSRFYVQKIRFFCNKEIFSCLLYDNGNNNKCSYSYFITAVASPSTIEMNRIDRISPRWIFTGNFRLGIDPSSRCKFADDSWIARKVAGEQQLSANAYGFGSVNKWSNESGRNFVPPLNLPCARRLTAASPGRDPPPFGYKCGNGKQRQINMWCVRARSARRRVDRASTGGHKFLFIAFAPDFGSADNRN